MKTENSLLAIILIFCLARVTLGYQQIVHVCEHEHIHIRCDKDESIQILSANYGRIGNNTICTAAPYLMNDRDCQSSTSEDKVGSVCKDQRECSLHASNSVFGDPCVGTYKYLTVTFECQHV